MPCLWENQLIVTVFTLNNNDSRQEAKISAYTRATCTQSSYFKKPILRGQNLLMEASVRLARLMLTKPKFYDVFRVYSVRILLKFASYAPLKVVVSHLLAPSHASWP
jgi:hypothetical protein